MDDTRQSYIASVLTDTPEEMYDPLDFRTVRKSLYKNVLNSVKKRFPLFNERYSLELADVDYDDPEDFSVADQKKAIMEGRTLGRRLRGSWVLRDISNNSVVQQTPRKTILRVPYLTERGTFIRNGNEYTFSHIMRLEPGVYTRKKDDDTILAQINAKQGTGTRMDMVFQPSTGIFKFQRGSINVPAYKVLSDYGVSDDQMKEAWGDELFKLNQDAGNTSRATQASERFYGNS